jgi:mono/diheme cytochrome c family protein
MKSFFLLLSLIITGIAIVLILYVKLVLPDVGNAPEISIEITSERVARGEYLANHVMVCADCHTMRDFSKYSGPLTGPLFAGGGDEFTREAGLPGNFYPPNLTPHHLGDWTDGELFRAIVAGVSRDGRALFPAMPYHLYGQADPEDIHAVIAYLRTLKVVESSFKPSEADFPVSLLINTMPRKIDPGSRPEPTDKVAYGRYMSTIAGCIECHTPMRKGKILWDEAFTGGREFIMPAGIVRTTNLTPDKSSGIGTWSEDDFVIRFRIYSDPENIQAVGEDNFNTPMPWSLYSKMTDTDLRAIYAYLQSIGPVENHVVRFDPAE